jgi:hypothetical protein
VTADLALVTPDPSALDTASPQVAAAMVTKALVESRSWLEVAMKGTDPTPIAEFKAWAATVEEATRQKNLGRDIELTAAEMVRRAERGIGVAIRRGQEAGEIRAHGQHERTVNQHGVAAVRLDETKTSPEEFFANSAERTAIYDVTDSVTDEQFDAAIDEAKIEGNLSRANVVRKVKGEPAPKPAGRPEHLRGMRHHDPNRIVEQTVTGLEGYVLGIGLIDFDRLDRTRLAAWSGSLTASLQSLNRLSRRLKELDQA